MVKHCQMQKHEDGFILILVLNVAKPQNLGHGFFEMYLNAFKTAQD